MGRQIQMLLSHDDEQKLVGHLSRNFPYFRVVNQNYPSNWDRRTLSRVGDTRELLMIDNRTIQILIDAAHHVAHGPLKLSWLIRSKARSCIEWDRELIGQADRQRLYLNTDPDPIWLDISAATGDDMDRMFRSACTWIRRNCVNCSQYKHGTWVSRSLEKAYRRKQAKRRTRPNLDPRDKRFYDLRWRTKARLTDEEIVTLISYCDKMIAYVSRDDEIANDWRRFKQELQERQPAK